MHDVELDQPFKVNTEGTAGAYSLVPVQQLEDVKSVLSAAGIRFSVSRDAIQMSGHDAIALIDFGRRGDARAIQAALDAREP